jgi:hypothetical protein
MIDRSFSDRLGKLFGAAGWKIQVRRGDADLLAQKGAHRYAVQMKIAHDVRWPLLEGLLASAILRARSAAGAMRAQPLAVLCARSISDRLLSQLQGFVDRYGEGVAWGALDAQGLAVFFAPGLEDIREERRLPQRGASPAPRIEIFSDLGQWLIKMLLSHRLPSPLQIAIDGHPVDRPIANAARLAKIAKVSAPRAARIVAALREEHVLRESAPLEIIRGDELLEQWLAANLKRPLDLRACWVLPGRDAARQLEQALRSHKQDPNGRACLGLFAACDRLGFSFVRGVAPHLYLEDPSPGRLEHLGLRLAAPGESASVFVRRPIFPESVFRGAQSHAGLPVADVVQCWLDVSRYPARGPEMAEHLYKKVIGPSVKERR